ncbi:hypothetical protein [Vibrio owensii]|uniref:hypothetical protein n=1 Tax=Vibrio owensii TaxID=696485 RepID=UPI0018F10BBA|nr:hypothetical protein [Vibrio owensii]
MARPTAKAMHEYISFLINKVESGEVEADKVNANMLVELGGARSRREEAITLFNAVHVDEDGKLIPVSDDVTRWIEEISAKLLEVQTIALSSARFETARQLVDLKEKYATVRASLTESSENLTEVLEQVQDLEAEKLELTNKFEKERLALIDKTTECEKLQSDYSVLEAKVETAEGKVDSTKQLLEVQTEKAQMYKEDAQRLEGEVVELNATKSKLELLVESERQEKSEIKGRLEEEQKKVSDASQELLRTQLESANRLTEQQETHSEEVKKLEQAHLSEKVRLEQAVTSEKERSGLKLSELEAQVAELRKQLEAEKGLKVEAETKVATLSAKNEVLERLSGDSKGTEK